MKKGPGGEKVGAALVRNLLKMRVLETISIFWSKQICGGQDLHDDCMVVYPPGLRRTH